MINNISIDRKERSYYFAIGEICYGNMVEKIFINEEKNIVIVSEKEILEFGTNFMLTKKRKTE